MLSAQAVQIVPVTQTALLFKVEWPVDDECERTGARAEVLHCVESADFWFGLDQQHVTHVVFCGRRQREHAANTIAQHQLDVGHAWHRAGSVGWIGELENFQLLYEVVAHFGDEELTLGVRWI